MARACSVEGCEKRHNAKGYCAMHGMRLARYGDLDNAGPLYHSATGLCEVEGCDRKHIAKGMCQMHYIRVKKYGATETVEQLTCARCSKDFPRPYKSNPKAVRFCSHECRYAQQLADARADKVKRYEAMKAWRAKNPELLRAAWLRRKARKNGSEARTVTGADIRRLIARHDGLCAYCKTEPFEHIDHVVPLARGGRHAIGNLLPACQTCNLTKGAKTLSEWRLRAPLPRRFQVAQGATQ